VEESIEGIFHCCCEEAAVHGAEALEENDEEEAGDGQRKLVGRESRAFLGVSFPPDPLACCGLVPAAFSSTTPLSTDSLSNAVAAEAGDTPPPPPPPSSEMRLFSEAVSKLELDTPPVELRDDEALLFFDGSCFPPDSVWAEEEGETFTCLAMAHFRQ